MINHLLHRQAGLDDINARTTRDMIEKTGEGYLGFQLEWSREALAEAGWDSGACLPKEDTIIDPAMLNPGIQPVDRQGNEVTYNEKMAEIARLIDGINAQREPMAQILSYSLKLYQVELNGAQATKTSLDGVGSRRRKDTRGKGSANGEAASYARDENDGPADYSRAPIRQGGRRWRLRPHILNQLD